MPHMEVINIRAVRIGARRNGAVTAIVRLESSARKMRRPCVLIDMKLVLPCTSQDSSRTILRRAKESVLEYLNVGCESSNTYFRLPRIKLPPPLI